MIYTVVVYSNIHKVAAVAKVRDAASSMDALDAVCYAVAGCDSTGIGQYRLLCNVITKDVFEYWCKYFAERGYKLT